MIPQPEKGNEEPAARFLAGVKEPGRSDLPPRATFSISQASFIARRVRNPKKRNPETNEVDQSPHSKSKVGDAACVAGKASKKAAQHSKDAGKDAKSISRAPLVAPATRLGDMPSFRRRPIGITGRRFILKHEFVTKSGAVFSGFSFQVNKHTRDVFFVIFRGRVLGKLLQE
jgi:mannose-6-phosphate isomerase-like protein (cupin superfamily)